MFFEVDIDGERHVVIPKSAMEQLAASIKSLRGGPYVGIGGGRVDWAAWADKHGYEITEKEDGEIEIAV